MHALATPGVTQVLLAHHERGGDSRFARETFESRFACERLTPAWQTHEVGPDVHLYRLTPRLPAVITGTGGTDAADGCQGNERDLDANIVAAACRGDIRALKRQFMTVRTDEHEDKT